MHNALIFESNLNINIINKIFYDKIILTDEQIQKIFLGKNVCNICSKKFGINIGKNI